MTLTIAQTAARALNAAQGAISDAIPAATLTRATVYAYDADNDTQATFGQVWTGRSVFQSVAPPADMFPAYVVGPGDEFIMLEGFASVIKNDVLTVGARTLTIMAVRDIMGAGRLFNVMAR